MWIISTCDSGWFYYSANQWDWTNTIESGCVPKNSQIGNRYDYVAKTPRDVELKNDIVWKLVVSRPRLAFSDTFERTSRVTAESARALRDGANVVRTETGNYFFVRICNKFLISDCRGDWDLGLCIFWVLAKREPLRKSDFRKKPVSPAENIGFCHRSMDLINASTQKVHRPRSQSPLHFDIRNS